MATNPSPLAGAPVAIQITDLVKSFGATTALDRITAQIAGGRLTGLVGPDGAGKTTLMRLLAGLMRPTQGHIVVAGCDTVSDRDALAYRVGYMPQRFGLYEDLSVLENMRLYAGLQGLVGAERQSRFEQLLALKDSTSLFLVNLDNSRLEMVNRVLSVLELQHVINPPKR